MDHKLEPYQHQVGIANAATGAHLGQVRFAFPAVPANKRLVLESISAQLGPAGDTVVLEGNGLSLLVPIINQASGVLTQQITLYFNPGDTPTARIFVGSAPPPISVIVALVGRLVAAE
jgi:hypothetical protein